MYGTKELREHLQEKLGVGDRQLRRLIATKAADLPSTKQQALFVLAHENRMRLSDYLTSEQIGEVRSLAQGRAVPAPAARSNGGRAAARRTASPRTVSMTIGTEKYGAIPALKSSHASEARAMAERVYPLLYVFENSLKGPYGAGAQG